MIGEPGGLVWQSGEWKSVSQKSGCEVTEAGKAEEKEEQWLVLGGAGA